MLPDQLVITAQIAWRCKTDLQHGLAARRKREHLIALEIAWQITANGIETIADLRRRNTDVATHVGKLQEDIGAVGTAVRIDTLDAVHGRNCLFGRPGYRAFDL